MAEESLPEVVREFIRSFNEQDLDDFVAVLHREVELHSGRGLRRGVAEARRWATKKPGGVQQTVVLERVLMPAWGRGGMAIVEITRRWVWAEDGSPAGEEEMEWLITFDGGLVRSWRPYERRGEVEEVWQRGGWDD
ncbi:MAG TPA: nuclear transport factor 2 family protein [Solirubrobacterales bacterium]|nr:nuclear transport factor 2 family protein [Solirubrobacterales bacterium]